ncbi:MAG: cache domain-containing protein, partial [Spirochaetales bacterium]|nr:cache domain-containing protein [Spirochaetales bacterium]
MTVKSKFFLKYFIPVLLLSSSILLTLSYMEVKTELKTIKLMELNTVLLKENSLKNHLSNIITDLIYLISHYDLHDFLVDGNHVSEKRVQDGFLLISETRNYYDQIRFIDNLGMEVIRVNNNDGTPEITPEDKLQSKSERYYVRESLKLDPGQIYASPFDLNIENGTIEQPIKPMIRLGMPVFDRTGKNRGIVVINYRGQLLLEELNNLTVNSQNGISKDPTWLLNSDGYWLKGSSSEEEWSFMYPDRSEISFKESFPKEWKIISKTQSGQIHNSNGLTTYSTIYPFVNRFNTDKQSKMIIRTSNYSWKIVSFIPSEIVHKSILKVLWKYILIYILILVLLIPGILFLTTEQLRVKESEQNLKDMLVKRNLFQRSLLKIYQSEFNNLEEGIGDIIKMSHDLLDIDLLSVWLFNKEKTSITCM